MESAKYIICRACALPKDAQLSIYWEQLKALIASASPSLFEQIANTDHSALDQLDKRTRISIERYFNRTRFRPVPYGKFSTVGLLRNEENKNDEPVLHTQMELLNFRDWTEIKKLATAAITWTDELMWRTQATLYTHEGTHYFFQSTEGQTELFSLNGFEELDRLLSFCSLSRSTAEIKDLVGNDWDFFRDMMSQLLELQVLVHSHLPNITGADYFQRIGLATFGEQLNDYSIYIRHAAKGFCNIGLEQELERYVAFANEHLPSPTLNDLAEFKLQFTKRYENQWQPLARVLDPEKGLGYAGLSNSGNDDLVTLLPKQELMPQYLLLDDLSMFLLNGMLGGKAVNLENFTGKNIDRVALPNTLNVLLQPAKDGVWAVEHIGGPSATNLLGRFAKDTHIANFTGELVDLEQKANAEVKFFDIAYQTDQRTDNINRRPQLYELELTLGGWSTHPKQLQLADLFINVIGDELVLYSNRYQCRVVPRMASAYNILRSSHPLLRLLADLQYQGMQHQFLPDLEQRFPNMDYYPPLKFGKLLLQPAKWKVPSSAKVAKTELDKWLDEKVCNRFIRIGRSDQYLCLDLELDMDRELLWDSLQRDAGLQYISDWPSGGEQGMLDTEGNRFSYQLHWALTHQKQVYAPVTVFNKPPHQKNWSVGSDWFFMSLYASPENQTHILKELIAPLLLKHENVVQNWFYILYSDPDKHIRLRIKWHADASAKIKWQVLNEIGGWLGSYGIRNTVMKPYEPEWQRYGTATMMATEHFFELDSVQATAVMDMDEEERLKVCYGWIWGMIGHVLKDHLKQKLFLEKMASMFAHEMGWSKVEFKILNQYWRNMEIPAIDAFPKANMLQVWEEICLITSAEDQEQRLADFIHMHVNRRFPTHARVREAQLYQYLLLHLKRVSKRAELALVAVR
ncbi:thiopeptide-type bacteriocin biosynthesis protein [Pedobacter xixiisoli]|uniref:Thiopeptide-type bacteriocin biosynthesis domain-containing protein n=1 Tax=Pedobacter xixiisoli TaxID=1476464 RepID=A0A286ADX1_9SPHI|nr:thiopeptide-type bacteriocin biosynthesis protein [Pedobacter xixiisoli]SOD20098.1 thiopeptide-type bacteriocin biosynthesis domain-containing protein [Pedobacter xixiisoli]